MVSPTLPAIMNSFGVSGRQIGWVMGVYTLAAALFMPVIGVLADRFGRKKALIPALVINGLAGLGTALSSSFEMILFFRFLQGIGIAGMMPLVMTLVGDLYDGKERVRVMGSISATTGMGSALAPFIGGMLAGIVWRVPFFLYFLTIPLALLIFFIIPKEDRAGKQKPLSSYLSLFVSAPNRVRILGIMSMALLSFLLLYSLIIYIPLLLTGSSYDLSEFWAGLFLAIQGITSGIVSFQARRLSEKFQRPHILAAGFTLMSGALFFIFFSSALWQIITALLIFGSGFGSVQPQINTWITEQVGGPQRGGLVSLFNTMKYVGQTLSPLLFGAVLAGVSVEMVFAAAGIIGIASITAAFSLKYTRPPKTGPTPHKEDE
ncbi:MAG: MFS transporter [Spirochaetales bacterium]|nr:MFS transporter [Spirochaetales bacterium]MCF7937430.1 MFS transporter [Spirochaetales bacterium]